MIWLHTIEIYGATYTLSTASTAENGGHTLSAGDTLTITSTGSIERGPTGWLSVRIPQNGTIINQGLLTGKMHFADSQEMQRKLMAEGIPVVDDQIQAFDSFFWDPKELG